MVIKFVFGLAFRYLHGCKDMKYLAHPFAIPFGMIGILDLGSCLAPGVAVRLVQCSGGFVCCHREENFNPPVSQIHLVSFRTGRCFDETAPLPSILIPIVRSLCFDPTDALCLFR